jgi:LuxR family transcriptional regulator, maltose regulon positive regulatory protein
VRCRPAAPLVVGDAGTPVDDVYNLRDLSRGLPARDPGATAVPTTSHSGRPARDDQHPADDSRHPAPHGPRAGDRIPVVVASNTDYASVTSPTGLVARARLFEALETAGRVTVIAAPAGSGKTFLARSWVREAELEGRVAYVSLGEDLRDAQRFWLSVVDVLRGTTAGSRSVRAVTAAPDLDAWAIVERLLEDCLCLDEPTWLVIDDLHQLYASEALRQLELLLTRAPAKLRFVLLTRRDLPLGLHRLRLEGELTEIRARDLRFSLEEAEELFEAAGVRVCAATLARLTARTEGWAAGLRLAALSLVGHPDPERFAAEFSGSERTVAEYLVAEVLEHQPEDVRLLLLRTAILERVNGPLADVLTRGSGGERVFQELEEAHAFVLSLDAGRSWFRYHHLFAELLQFELRHNIPEEIPALHAAAAEWFAGHGYPVEAVRHAQAAEDWELAGRVLSDHWLGLVLDGQATIAHELITGFPSPVLASDPEIAAVAAGVELARGSLGEAERHLVLADRGATSVPGDRRPRFQVTLAVLRLELARQRFDLPTVADEAQRLLAAADRRETAELELGEDLRALALISLGGAEAQGYALPHDEPLTVLGHAERHLDRGIALARRIDRPYLELTARAHKTLVATFRSDLPLSVKRSMEAIELAERHGWSEEPVIGIAYVSLGGAMLSEGRREEAALWFDRAERALRVEVEPAAMVLLHHFRGLLELAAERYREALGEFQRAERLIRLHVTCRGWLHAVESHVLQTLVMMGQTERAREALADMNDQERATPYMAVAVAALSLAQGEPEAATTALASVIDRAAPVPVPPFWIVDALLLEALARERLGEARASARALERALDLAEVHGVLLAFLIHPVPGLLKRHRRYRTPHTSLISRILTLTTHRPPALAARPPEKPPQQLSEIDIRALGDLPITLSDQATTNEFHGAENTAKPQIRRPRAIEQARAAAQAERIVRDLIPSVSQLGRLVLGQTAGEISPTRAAILRTLSGGPRRVTELAELEGLAQPTTTLLIKQLEQSGYVERGRDPEDGRAVLVSLTAGGAAALERYGGQYRAALRDRISAMPDEQIAALEDAVAAIGRLVEAMQNGNDR